MVYCPVVPNGLIDIGFTLCESQLVEMMDNSIGILGLVRQSHIVLLSHGPIVQELFAGLFLFDSHKKLVPLADIVTLDQLGINQK
jgi:hypothetical protein